jgi:hypothetical protein
MVPGPAAWYTSDGGADKEAGRPRELNTAVANQEHYLMGYVPGEPNHEDGSSA